MSTKGESTKSAILERATQLASRLGLAGLSIGTLADDMGLSKSGVFAHFQSKEALQVQMLEFARGEFVERVVSPALRQPRGLPRVRALFEGWVAWGKSDWLPGGCVFQAAVTEVDDQAGPLREAVLQTQVDWLDTLAQAARQAIQAGHFRADLDAEQFAFEFYAAGLGFFQFTRLLRSPQAEARFRSAFEALLDRSRVR